MGVRSVYNATDFNLFQVMIKRTRSGFGFSVTGTCPVQVCSVEESKFVYYFSSSVSINWHKVFLKCSCSVFILLFLF